MVVVVDKCVVVGGNFGILVFDLLVDDIELYVLELLSFQLEICDCFNVEVVIVLNVSEDYMDCYDGMVDYYLVKYWIFCGVCQVVVNCVDVLI